MHVHVRLNVVIEKLIAISAVIMKLKFNTELQTYCIIISDMIINIHVTFS